MKPEIVAPGAQVQEVSTRRGGRCSSRVKQDKLLTFFAAFKDAEAIERMGGAVSLQSSQKQRRVLAPPETAGRGGTEESSPAKTARRQQQGLLTCPVVPTCVELRGGCLHIVENHAHLLRHPVMDALLRTQRVSGQGEAAHDAATGKSRRVWSKYQPSLPEDSLGLSG